MPFLITATTPDIGLGVPILATPKVLKAALGMPNLSTLSLTGGTRQHLTHTVAGLGWTVSVLNAAGRSWKLVRRGQSQAAKTEALLQEEAGENTANLEAERRLLTERLAYVDARLGALDPGAFALTAPPDEAESASEAG